MQVLLTDKNHDPVFNALYLNDINNILEEESSIKIYIPEREFVKLKKLRKFLIEEVGLKESIIIINDFEDKNWNEEWEKSIEPVYIRDKIYNLSFLEKEPIKRFL